MNYISLCLKELFGLQTAEPSGLCYFEHADEPGEYTPVKPERKKEMRLSELME